MDKPIKIIAFHLPQFHAFKENDEWWGKGFTEWTNTKKAQPQYRGHYQPREPLNDNYYDLSDVSSLKAQADLAKRYGIYGFCFYHYWFGDGHILMQKPIEKFLNDNTIDIKFCISWANETWSRRWNGSDKDLLIKQEHGDKDTWIKHFYYLLPFFKDERYILFNGKPLFILYKPEIFQEYQEMFSIWNELAINNGLTGLSFGIQGAIWNNIKNVDDSGVDLRIMYEPGFTGCQNKAKKGLRIGFTSKLLKLKNLGHNTKINYQSYSAYCNNILKRKIFSDKLVPGMFVDWDNTARRGGNATVFLGSSPKKFGRYFTRLLIKTKNEFKNDFIFINAWNEWAEGCYLEPDKKNKYGYLEEIKKALYFYKD